MDAIWDPDMYISGDGPCRYVDSMNFYAITIQFLTML